MEHYVYAMSSSADSIVQGMPVGEWFTHYKLGNGPDVFVPFPEDSLPELPVAGDLVWFVMDELYVYGFAEITDVRPDPCNDRIEVVYDSDKVRITEHVGIPSVWHARMGKTCYAEYFADLYKKFNQ